MEFLGNSTDIVRAGVKHYQNPRHRCVLNNGEHGDDSLLLRRRPLHEEYTECFYANTSLVTHNTFALDRNTTIDSAGASVGSECSYRR